MQKLEIETECLISYLCVMFRISTSIFNFISLVFIYIKEQEI